MWPFGVPKRLNELEESLLQLQRNFRALELEWGDVYDKLKRRMGRIEKSRAIMERVEGTNGEEVVAEPQQHSLLTPRQHQIQQQILRRRSNL